MPASALRIIQLGQETSWGTAVTPTVILPGVTGGSFKAEDEVSLVRTLGGVVPARLAAQVRQNVTGSTTLTATYENILYLLHGIFGAVTPTGSGPYVWAYTPPGDGSSATPQAYTVIWGTSGAVYQITGGLITQITLRAEAGGLWEASADWIGKAMTTGTLASLSQGTGNVIRAGDTALYLDSWTGVMGTTSVDATLISAELSVNTGRHLKTFVGSVQPQAYGDGGWESSLRLVVEFNTTSKAIVDALLTPGLVQRQIRLKATSGTNVFQVDFCGTLTNGVELFGDRDGNMTLDLSWSAQYNSTYGGWLAIGVTNSEEVLD